jgi:glycosyltransferase involved in cell wall biosynthesis
MKGTKVSMFVYNNCDKDARVLKEASSLVNAGYQVKIFAVLDAKTVRYEVRDGIEIIRVNKDPLHYRFFRLDFKGLFGKAKLPSITSLRTNYKGKPASKTASKPKAATPAQPKSTGQKKPKRTLKSMIGGLVKAPLLIVHRPLCYYDFYRKTKGYCNEEPADVYHAHDLNTFLPASKAARRHKSQLVYDSHELYTHRNKPVKSSKLYRYLTERFERKHIRRAAKVITVSESIADYLRDKYTIERPIVIMNAPSKVKVHKDGKSLRKELNVSDDLKLAIYCGGITFNRGLEKLIESLTVLPDVYLVLMGYGAPAFLEKLQKIADDNGVSDRFSFYGPVQPHEVTSYTASADVGVAPIRNVCLSYYFCAPNKVFEYIIGGIPVVASNFPDLTKIVSENEIGFVFDPDDIHSIADSINRIFEDKVRYEKMKANTQLATTKYNWEIEEQKLLDLYKSITN